MEIYEIKVECGNIEVDEKASNWGKEVTLKKVDSEALLSQVPDDVMVEYIESKILPYDFDVFMAAFMQKEFSVTDAIEYLMEPCSRIMGSVLGIYMKDEIVQELITSLGEHELVRVIIDIIGKERLKQCLSDELVWDSHPKKEILKRAFKDDAVLDKLTQDQVTRIFEILSEKPKLLWEQKTEKNCEYMYTWDEALRYVERLNYKEHLGHSNWRLPTVAELSSIVHPTLRNPCVDPVKFPHTKMGNYWAHTEGILPREGCEWCVSFCWGV